MSLYRTGSRLGRALGQRSARELRGLRAFFATAGRRLMHPVRRTFPRLPQQLQYPQRPPNYLRLGIESKLDVQRARDVGEMNFLANLQSKKVKDPFRFVEYSSKWTEGHRRRRVARELRTLRKTEGPKSAREVLKRAGQEFRKRAY